MNSSEHAPDDLERLVGSTAAGKYRIEKLIGRGGMGAVFLATNTGIGKRVALKFLSPDAAADRSAALRFQREAEAAGRVESEHIVHVFDSGTNEAGLPFLVMELLDGEDLRARLKRERTLPASDAVTITSQVLRALVRAHAAGIVHRDLKPDNVFLCRRDDGSHSVKLVDFGISKLDRSSQNERLTRRGTVLGSAYYMSPEQAQASDAVDARSDIYSVGAMLFEMLSGRPPHLAPTYEGVLVAICTQDALDVRSLVPVVPQGVADAVARALARNPAGRYASAAEMLQALLHAESDSSPGERPKARSRALVIGLASALLGFTLTAVLVVRKRSSGAEAAPPHAQTASAKLPPVVPLAESVTVMAKRDPAPAVPSAPAASNRSSTPAPPPAPTGTALRGAERSKTATPTRADAGVARSLKLSTREP